ncbi:FtsL-like putative cell division protein [uncultured Cyclobacterium sp.]|uniref:FtsL-like putative cell division protein n=1 Tax=uncultured Cyclobacterium sp. TaxID=453820 RepID=UPI0030ED5ED3|tara:strand:- start:293226 stop:293606 length:381 start_codon:yes stop_codon:yes gene_type:complete
MGRNTFKSPIKSSKDQKKSRFNPFAFIEQKLDISALIGENVPVKFVLPLLYASFLAMVYIWSNYKAENTIRKIDRIQQEVEDLRADVTTLEAEYMYASKQSEVAKKIQPLGIVEIEEPPQKIVLEK